MMNPDEEAFLRTIWDNPEDETARLVFADWLKEHGDPRGDWLRDDEIWEWMAPDATNPIPKLREALRDSSYYDRQKAAKTLGRMGEGAIEAVPELVAAMNDSEDNDQDCFDENPYAEALGKIGGEEAISALSYALNTKRIRCAAAEALGTIGPAAIHAVPNLQKTVGKKDVGQSAAWALLRISEPEGIFALGRYLRCKNWEKRKWAAECLGESGAEALKPLLSALCDDDSDVQRAVTESLVQIIEAATAKDVPALASALDSGSDRVRRSAAQALERIGGDAWSAVPQLIEGLRDPVARVRCSVANVLGKIGVRAAEAIPQLAAALCADDDTYARSVMAAALTNMGSEAARAVPELLNALRDGDRDLRGTAAWALTKIQGAEAIPTLIAALEDPESEVREEVAAALGRVGLAAVHQAEPALRKLLKDGDRDVRRQAAQALGKIGVGAPEAVPELRNDLYDDSEWDRITAATTLIAIGEDVDDALAALVRALGNSLGYQHAAALALGKIGPRAVRAVPSLRVLLNNESEATRQAAQRAIDLIIQGS